MNVIDELLDQAPVAAGTGKVVEGRSRYDSTMALISVIYLLLLLAFFFWTLFDIWVGENWIATRIGYIVADLEDPEAGIYRLVTLTVLGGGLGGIIFGLRSFLQHTQKFDGRFVWKYITAPWLGATNALFVFALINSGLAVFGGSGSASTTDFGQVVAMFSVGVLAGYGSQDVFLWLDAQVTKLFKYEVMVPSLRNKSEAEVEKVLARVRLQVGVVTEVVQHSAPPAGRVIAQEPVAGTMIDKGSAVNFTVAVLSSAEGEPPPEAHEQPFAVDSVIPRDGAVRTPVG